MDALFLTTCLLGHPSFAVREQASQYLLQAGPLAYAHAVACASSPDPEIAWRGGRIADVIRRGWAEAAADQVRPTQFARLPWMDGLGQDWPDRSAVICHYLEVAGTKAPTGKRGWWSYRVATREFVRDQLAAGASWESVVAMLDVMADAELEWIERNRHHDHLKLEMAELLPAPPPAK